MLEPCIFGRAINIEVLKGRHKEEGTYREFDTPILLNNT